MANNVPVQGTSADYLKLAEVQIYKWIYAKGWNKLGEDGFPLVRMMLSIHDELIISADKSIPYEEIILMITKCMEIPVKDAPPFFVQPAKMENWGGHSDDAVAMPILLRNQLINDYIETGKSKINESNYIDVLNQYRQDKLNSYMHSMISKYGPDPTEVGKKIDDGVLTFELLSLYEKGIKKKHPDIGQRDLIIEATKCYMNDNTHMQTDTLTIEEKIENNPNDTSSVDELTTLVEFDKEGNVIYEEGSDEDELDTFYESEDVDTSVSGINVYAWMLFDQIVIDTFNLTKSEIDKVLAYVYQYSTPSGFYKCELIYNNNLIDTKLRIENIDMEALNTFIEKLTMHIPEATAV